MKREEIKTGTWFWKEESWDHEEREQIVGLLTFNDVEYAVCQEDQAGSVARLRPVTDLVRPDYQAINRHIQVGDYVIWKGQRGYDGRYPKTVIAITTHDDKEYVTYVYKDAGAGVSLAEDLEVEE